MRSARPLRRRMLALFTLTAIGFAGCLDQGAEDPLGNSAPDLLGREVWTLILAEDSTRVWVAQSDTAFALHDEDQPAAVSAAIWSVLDSAPDARDLRLRAAVHGRTMSWTLSRDDVQVGEGNGRALTYVGERGTLRFAGTAVLTWAGQAHAVRFDAIGGLPMPEQPVTLAPAPGRPRLARGIVSLRIDDCHAGDAATFALLRRYHFVAEFAIPTRLVGRNGFCSRDLLRSIADGGNAVEAHSRFHERSPRSFADFYIETVGSLRDLVALGYHPHNFIQPGTWDTGAPFLNTSDRLNSPYGALLRRAFVSTEAYASPAASPIPAIGRTGPSSFVLPGFSSSAVSRIVHDASEQGQWVQFMWHSGDQPADTIAANLATIAALRDSGFVDVMTFRDALSATPAPAASH